MRLSRQFQFFLRSAKQMIFLLSDVLCAKNCCLCCILFACFCFFSWFLLNLHFCVLKIFSKKIEIVLIDSFTILQTCTPINSPSKNLFLHTYFYLWSSVRISIFMRIFSFLWLSLRIYFFKSLWKSTSVWISSSKANLLSSKTENDILLILYVTSYKFYFELFSFYVWPLFY